MGCQRCSGFRRLTLRPYGRSATLGSLFNVAKCVQRLCRRLAIQLPSKQGQAQGHNVQVVAKVVQALIVHLAVSAERGGTQAPALSMMTFVCPRRAEAGVGGACQRRQTLVPQALRRRQLKRIRVDSCHTAIAWLFEGALTSLSFTLAEHGRADISIQIQRNRPDA